MSSNLKGANAAKMKRMMSRKSHSWWWDSHINPKNSKWLAENLEEMDCCVKEMLKLIEEEGDSFAKKAEMYYKKRPELISHVEDFYRLYRSLADRYNHVTGELRMNIQSELNSPGSGGGSDFGSEPPSQSVPCFDRTPEPKHTIPKPGHRAAGFEFFLGSGRSLDKSRKGSDDSSSSSESDSDPDDAKDLNGDVDGISSGLHQRILELENELCVVKEKLSEHENCGELANGHADLSSKISVLENDLLVANEKLQVSESEIVTLQQKLKEKSLSSEAMSVELGYENMVLSKLEIRVVELETEARDKKREIEDLKGVISASNLETEQYKTQLVDASEKFLQEKSHLEADTIKLEGVIKELKEEIDRISQEKLQLETSILEQQNLIEELKAAAGNSDNLLKEKSHFEVDILKLEGVIEELKEEIKRISLEKSLLEISTSQQQNLITALKATAEASADKFSVEMSLLKVEMSLLKAEISTLSQSNVLLEEKLIQLDAEKAKACTERDGQIAELNLSLDALKQKVATLLLEKDELGARMSALNDDIRCRDDRVHRMDEHLHQLHLEHVKLMKELDEARRTGTELRDQVKELEEEVERQRVAISDGAEGKREAIRQLCFSLEHYRDGYHHLQQVLQGHSKRPPTVIAI